MDTSTRRKKSVPQLARQWGVAPKKVTDFIKSGELRAINLARKPNNLPRYAIDIADIEAFERSREIVPSAGPTTRKLRKPKSETKDYFPS